MDPFEDLYFLLKRRDTALNTWGDALMDELREQALYAITDSIRVLLENNHSQFYKDLAIKCAVASAELATSIRFRDMIDGSGDESDTVSVVLGDHIFFEILTGSWVSAGAAVPCVRNEVMTEEEIANGTRVHVAGLAAHSDWTLSLTLVRLAAAHALANNDL